MVGMVISHELKFVFLGIPRTANRAMHLALLGLPGAFSHGRLHEMGMPDDCSSYFTFCCVRNPYRRFLAYYRWRQSPHTWIDDGKGFTFDSYIEAMEQGLLGARTIAEHVCNNRLDKVIRYEELPHSFHSLEAFIPEISNVAMKKCGSRLSRHWKEYYNEYRADRVYRLCQSDFEEYGYDKDSWRS